MIFFFWALQIIFFVWFSFLLVWPKTKQNMLKNYNLAFSFLILIIVLLMGISAHSSSVTQTLAVFDFRFITFLNFQFSINYSIALDSLAYLFLLLTAFLIPLCMLSIWNSIKFLLAEFMFTIALVEWMLLNMFMVTDLLLFYIWFEAILLPMYFLIGTWGSRQRKTYASFMFFFYTFLGSLFMLYALISLYAQQSTLNFFNLIDINLTTKSHIIWLLFMLAFAVKVPMFPAHIWLPEAHVEAPTVGSVLLAGVLLKLGIFALLRFLIPMFPWETQYYSPIVSIFAVLGILYISLTTMRQTDLKKIIAYASIAHMNYVVLGIFGINVLSLSGAIFLMIGHGLVSAGLFFLIGFMYDRYKTRNIRYYRGMVSFMPVYAVIFLIFTLANMSFPGTCNFIGEALILFGLTQTNILTSFLSALGIVFCAVYSIWLFNRTMYGPITPCIINFSDLSKREFFVVMPLALLTIFLGIFPNTILNLLNDTIVLQVASY